MLGFPEYPDIGDNNCAMWDRSLFTTAKQCHMMSYDGVTHCLVKGQVETWSLYKFVILGDVMLLTLYHIRFKTPQY